MAAAPVTFDSPLGDSLLFRDLSWTESLGTLPEGLVTLLSTTATIKANDLLGKQVGVQFALAGGRKRCFNGFVTGFQRGGTIGRYFCYRLTINPWLWFLTRTSDCRIFLEKKAPDIVKEIFADHPISKAEYTLYGDYPPLTQCVQYRETDFSFVSRMLERHGMYYRFDYTEDGKQSMQLFDAAGQHEDDPNLKELMFLPEGGRLAPVEGYLSEWGSVRTVQPGKFALNDFHYERPNSPLLEHAGQPDAHDLAKYEMYDSPFGYDQAGAGTLYVKVVDDQSGAEFDVFHGTTNAYDLRIGRTVKVTKHGDDAQNAKYLVIGASFILHYSGHEADAGQDGTHFECRFSAIPAAQQFRPAPRTPRPFVHGPQLATVTGPAGEEIYTDKYGRIKVVFHWDRYGTRGQGKGDSGAAIPPDKTSCWVPVAQIWAGNNFGAMFVPRIKQEVIVEFLEGDPDRPIVTGRVYNQENPPPWTLPDNKTQSGVLTRSTLGGAYANANMVRFEDKKGAEQLSIHAEKNQDISVENDETHDVGHDRTKTIGNDETTHVSHDRTETVGNNESISIGVNRTEKVGSNESISIGANRTETVTANETVNIGANRTHTVGASETWTVAVQRTHTVGANETITVGGGQEVTVGAAQAVTVGAAQVVNVGADQSTSVGGNQSDSAGGNHNVQVGGDQSHQVAGNRTGKVDGDDALKVGKTLVIDAEDSVTIKTGSASITMQKDGTISIKGKDISVEGSGKINVKASSDVVIKGSKVQHN